MTIPYEDTLSIPLDSAEAILDRVTDLVGPAIRPQTWMMFLDADHLQLPLIVPVDEAPGDDLIGEATDLLTTLRTATNGATMIAVIERDSIALSDRDREWARVLRDVAAIEQIELRAILFSHARGVRGLGPDDLV